MRIAARACAGAGLVACACAAPPLAAQARGVPAARLGVRVEPETVTVGMPFTVRARVALPAAWRVAQPATPDTGGVVEPLDPPRVRDSVRAGERVADVTWRFMAWRPGTQPLPLAPLALRTEGARAALPVTASVIVRSVLPDDSAQRVPRPWREPVAAPRNWWPLIALVAAALALVGLLAWALGRAWRARRARAVTPRTPREVADAALDRLDARDLVALGEPRRAVALAGEIVRDFLAARVGVPVSLATGEALAVAGSVLGVHGEALAEFLARVDAVRFGDAPLDAAGVRALLAEARRLVAVLDERQRSPRATPLALEVVR